MYNVQNESRSLNGLRDSLDFFVYPYFRALELQLLVLSVLEHVPAVNMFCADKNFSFLIYCYILFRIFLNWIHKVLWHWGVLCPWKMFFFHSFLCLLAVYTSVVKCSKHGASWRPCTMFLKKWTLSCFFLLSRHVSSKVLEWTLIGCHNFCVKCAISWQCHVALSQLWRWLFNASGWWQLLKGASPCFVVCQ